MPSIKAISFSLATAQYVSVSTVGGSSGSDSEPSGFWFCFSSEASASSVNDEDERSESSELTNELTKKPLVRAEESRFWTSGAESQD